MRLPEDAAVADETPAHRRLALGHGHRPALGQSASWAPSPWRAAGRTRSTTSTPTLLESVATQLSLAIKNAQLYDEIKQMHLGNLMALSSALNAKDYYTLGHAARVAAYTVMLGHKLQWGPELMASLEEAAYLHDIGKISISDRVLLKPRPPEPAGVAADAAAPGVQRRHHPAALPQGARGRRPAPPRALRRRRATRTASRASRSRCSPAPWPWWTPTTPCRAGGRTRPRSPTASASQSCAAAAGRSSTPPWSTPSSRCSSELEHTRATAERIAAEAASRIPGDKHRALRRREDEDTRGVPRDPRDPARGA